VVFVGMLSRKEVEKGYKLTEVSLSDCPFSGNAQKSGKFNIRSFFGLKGATQFFQYPC